MVLRSSEAIGWSIRLRRSSFMPLSANRTTATAASMKYRGLLAELPRFQAPADPLVRRTVAYFEDRDAYEKKDFKRFTQRKLIQFREERAAFSGPGHERLFDLWKSSGEQVLMAHLRPPSASKPNGNGGEFGTYLLKFNYELFGTLLNGKATAKACGQ